MKIWKILLWIYIIGMFYLLVMSTDIGREGMTTLWDSGVSTPFKNLIESLKELFRL